MKRFIRNLIIFICCVVVAFLAVFIPIQCLPPQFSDTFDAAAIDKYDLLMKTESPKIILVSGSNFAFGMNSEELSQAFSMPVVNLGLHAGIKPHFTVKMAEQNIGEGDIILVGFEYEQYGKREIDVPTAMETIENYPRMWKLVSPADYFLIFKGYLSEYGFIKIDRYQNGYEPTTGAYARNAFDEYGDNDYPRTENIRTSYEQDVEIDDNNITDSMIRELNHLNKIATKNGAKVYLTYPSIDQAVILTNEDEWEKFDKKLQENLDFPIISKMRDYIFDSQYFYDTDYHLTMDGREIRTKQLISDMEEFGIK